MSDYKISEEAKDRMRAEGAKVARMMSEQFASMRRAEADGNCSHRWISVKEKPPMDTLFLFYEPETKQIWVGYLSTCGDYWHPDEWRRWSMKPTHYMPLPDKPR